MDVQTALVTGASSGIGLELARLLASHDHPLVLVARSATRLATIAAELQKDHGVRVWALPLDLSEPGAVHELWRELTAAEVSVDVLVNNAGVGMHGAFARQDPEAIQRMLMVNVSAVTALTRLALPGMVARRKGRILNVASLAAFQPGGPGEAAYYATKSFVLSFSRGLAHELRGSGVSVTALCPGPTESAFAATAGSADAALYRGSLSSAAAVAHAGYRGMMHGAGVVIPGMLTKLLAFAGQLPPRRIALAINSALLR